MKNYQILVCATVSIFIFGCKAPVAVPPPHVRVNPAPKEKYEISLEFLDDRKRPSGDVTGVITYEIKNRNCMPVDYARSLGGSRPMVFRGEHVRLNKIAENRYVISLYTDKFIDENYYELGVCKWQINSISMDFNILGQPYSSGFWGKRIENEEYEFKYCLEPEVRFSGADIADCVPDVSKVTQRYNKNEFFKIKITSKRNRLASA